MVATKMERSAAVSFVEPGQPSMPIEPGRARPPACPQWGVTDPRSGQRGHRAQIKEVLGELLTPLAGATSDDRVAQGRSAERSAITPRPRRKPPPEGRAIAKAAPRDTGRIGEARGDAIVRAVPRPGDGDLVVGRLGHVGAGGRSPCCMFGMGVQPRSCGCAVPDSGFTSGAGEHLAPLDQPPRAGRAGARSANLLRLRDSAAAHRAGHRGQLLRAASRTTEAASLRARPASVMKTCVSVGAAGRSARHRHRHARHLRRAGHGFGRRQDHGAGGRGHLRGAGHDHDRAGRSPCRASSSSYHLSRTYERCDGVPQHTSRRCASGSCRSGARRPRGVASVAFGAWPSRRSRKRSTVGRSRVATDHARHPGHVPEGSSIWACGRTDEIVFGSGDEATEVDTGLGDAEPDDTTDKN